jgi:hypothetical protein
LVHPLPFYDRFCIIKIGIERGCRDNRPGLIIFNGFKVLGKHIYPASLPKGKRYNFMAGKDESTSEKMLVQGLPAVNPPTS